MRSHCPFVNSYRFIFLFSLLPTICAIFIFQTRPRYLFVWLTFIAAAYAAGGKAHIGVTALVDIFPPAMKRVVELLTYLLCLGLSFILVYFTAIIMRTQIQYGQISPSLRLPMQYAYAGMAVGGIFMAIHFLLHICNFFAKPNSEEKGE